MIVDHLRNSSLYRSLHPRLAAGLDFLQSLDLASLAPGRTLIDGENLFAVRQEYETKPVEKGKWEAHRRYVDIQYIAEGVEQMGYAPLESVNVVSPYDEEKDYALFEGSGSLISFKAGEFAVFFPQDAHMPGLALETPSPVTKVVIKVLLD